MGLEEQVRTTLRAETERISAWTPDVTTIRRSARSRTRRRAALVGSVAALAAAAVTVTGMLDALRGNDTGPAVDDPGPPALRLLGEDEAVPPGRYSVGIPGTDSDELQVELDVPRGFRSAGPTLDYQMYVTGPETGGDDPLVGMSAWQITGVNPDPCHGEPFSAGRTYRDPGPTVGDLATALSRQPYRVGEPPKPVTLAGYEGLYLELRFPPGFDPGECASGAYEAWVSVDPSTRGRTERFWYGAGSVDRIWILDVEGRTVAVNAYQEERASEEARAALDDMVDSIEMRLGSAD
jgi:hypothetical protein